MNKGYYEELRNIRVGILFSLLTLLFGFGLGVTFGVFEDDIKDIYLKKAQNVKESVYGGNETVIKSATDKAWVYLTRAHLHANALGTTSLVLSLLLVFLGINDNMKAIVSFLLGGGALGFAIFWMLSSIATPSLGNPDFATSKYMLVAQMSAGACTVGLVSTAIASIQTLFKRHY